MNCKTQKKPDGNQALTKITSQIISQNGGIFHEFNRSYPN